MAFTFSQVYYSNVLLRQLRTKLVFGKVASYNQTVGQIVRGGSVQVLTPSAVATAPYAGSLSFTSITAAPTTVTISETTSFALELSAVSAAAITPELEQGAVENTIDDGAYRMAKDIDNYIASLYVNAGDTFTWSAALDESNILKFVGQVRDRLELIGALGQDSWLVLPSVCGSILSNATAKLYHTDVTGATADVGAGLVTQFMGLNIFTSPAVVTSTTPAGYNVMYGGRNGLGCAMSLSKLTYDDLWPVAHGTGVAGLTIFGAAAVQPSALGSLEITVA